MAINVNINVSPLGAAVLSQANPAVVSWIRVETTGAITLRTAAEALSDLGGISADSTTTLTNKRIVKRVTTVADATSIATNVDNSDAIVQENTQAVGVLTVSNPAGTPTDKQALQYEIKSTNIQTFSWGSNFHTTNLPTDTSGGGLIDEYTFQWSTLAGKWLFTGSALGF